MDASYTCDFGGGLVMVATIDRAALLMGKGRTQFVAVAITGKLVPGAIPQYRKWMLMIHRAAADLIQAKVLWVFQYSPVNIQTWECAPGKEPRQIDMAKIQPRYKGDPKCKRCGGRGFVGRNFRDKTLIVCSCVERRTPKSGRDRDVVIAEKFAVLNH